MMSLSMGPFRIEAQTNNTRPPERLYSSERPFDLEYIRVYERAPELKDPSVLTALWDLISGGSDPSSVDELIKDVGIVGVWRPSTITVRVWHLASNRLLVDGAIAHAIWNQRLDLMLTRGDGISIVVDNDEDRVRWIRIELVGTQWSAERIERYRQERGYQ